VLFRSNVPSASYESNYFASELEITGTIWNEFTSLINESNFWELPSILPRYEIKNGNVTIKGFITDGAQWIVEGCNKGAYHVVDRGSGFLSKEYKNIFIYLESLHQLELDYLIKY
jgi:hypothetical protein